MTKEEPFSATFKQEKETKNTVRYSEESEDRRPVVGTLTTAAAIDRLVHHSVILELNVTSYRMEAAKQRTQKETK